MVTRQQVVDEARNWLDTPYRHQGRLKGVACDCAGLVLGVAWALGLQARDVAGYPRRPDGTLADVVYDQTVPVPHGEEGISDVVVFKWANNPTHLALLTGPDSIIHAFAVNRKVCEHRIDENWRRYIMSYRRIPGVD